MRFLKNFSNEQKSWIMYDWANSAYSIVVTTAVLPVYYKSMTELSLSTEKSTLYWSIANTSASFIIAILAPILGSIADYQGLRKRFFTFFALLGIAHTFLLALVPFENWQAIIAIYIATVIGFAGANTFYDAFLTDVACENEMDKVSANGFAYGYIGSVIPFVICIGLIVFSEKLGLSTILATQLSFVITALWWGLFTIPMWKHVKQIHGKPRDGNEVRQVFQSLIKTLKKIATNKALLLFLIAYFFYIDGVNTIIKLATIIGTDVGIDSNSLIVMLLITQLVAFPATVLYGKLSDNYRTSSLIISTLIIYTLAGIYAMISLDSRVDFLILAVFIGTSQGAIQSLSRSYFAKMIPVNQANEFFGFYNIVGKFSSVLGPLLYGATFYLTSSVAMGIFSIIILFIIGGVLFVISCRIAKP